VNYFKNENNEVFGYDDEQIEIEAIKEKIKDLTSITEEEMKTLTYIEPIFDPKKVGEIYTLNSVDYQVPFAKVDGDALMQVNIAFQMGITGTNIHFSNGTKMPIKADEFQDFAMWFVNKRNSFFTEG
jgi:hypothetical protein